MHVKSWWISSVIVGLIYLFAISVDIDIKQKTPTSNVASLTISSNLKSHIPLHISAIKYPISSVVCQDQSFVFDTTLKWYQTTTQYIDIKLNKPIKCQVTVANAHKPYKLKAMRVYDIWDISILFITLILPTMYILFLVFIYILDVLKNKIPFTSTITLDNITLTSKQKTLLWFIILVGVVIRVLYFDKHGVMLFQHDWQGHIGFIKHMAKYWDIPLADKGLEYPQQLLYYILSASIYDISIHYFGLSEGDTLLAIGILSLVGSVIFLVYTYKILDILKASFIVRLIVVVFVSLTPSIIYFCSRINNDSLVLALSSVSLYYILVVYISRVQRGFFQALFFVTLLFFTKISTLSFELLLLFVLIVSYLKSQDTTIIYRYIWIYTITGALTLVLTLWKVYMPLESELFHLVNSSGYFPNQHISALDSSYFLSFHLKELLDASYSYVFGIDAIRHSFMTYQYGTMIFGEFDYSFWDHSSSILRYIREAMILSYLIVPLGLILYIINIHKSFAIEYMLFIALLINISLVIKFLHDYPVICNSDFRYLVASMIPFSYIYAKGLSFVYIGWFRYILWAFVSLQSISNIIFISYIIA